MTSESVAYLPPHVWPKADLALYVSQYEAKLHRAKIVRMIRSSLPVKSAGFPAPPPDLLPLTIENGESGK